MSLFVLDTDHLTLYVPGLNIEDWSV